MTEQTFSLKYLPMKISLISTGMAVLPAFLGSTLRGVLGQALYHDTNAFKYFYNQRSLNDNQQDIVNPYVIIPPSINETAYHTDEELDFEIFLLGDAVKYSQSIINALGRIQEFGLGASRHSFALLKVTHSLNQRIIWHNSIFHADAVESTALPCRGLPNVKRVFVHMLTPLRIRRDGALLEKIDFLTMIRNITRRVEALTMHYGGWVDKEEIARIQTLSSEVSMIQDSLEIKNMERYSTRLRRKMDFSGLLGTVQFEGDLTPFVPWLYAAQVLHIGRNTTFGMGRIAVEFI